MHDLLTGVSRAILGGSLAASVALVLLLPQPLEHGVSYDQLAALPLAIMFAMPFALALVALATLTIGLAIRWALGQLDLLAAETLGMCGAMVALPLFLLPALASGETIGGSTLALGLAAAIGGCTTGLIWGAAAEACATIPAPPKRLPCAAANRIEDPRMLR